METVRKSVRRSEHREQRFQGLWHHPGFLKLWCAQSISLIGSQVSEMALPLTVVLVLQGSADDMGVLKAAEALPWLLFGLLAGAWIDRMPRRPIMILADVGRALLLLTIPAATVLGFLNEWLIYGVAFSVGLLTVFFNVAYQSYLPSLVGKENLIDGNSKLEMSLSIAETAGPGLAGVLVQVLTAPMAIAIDAVSFVLSAQFLSRIKFREPALAKKTDDPRTSIWKDIGEGVGIVFGNPMLRALALFMGTANLFVTVVWTVLPLYAIRELSIQPFVYGIILAVGIATSVPAALSAGWVSRRLGIGWTTVAGGILGGGGYFLIPFSSWFPDQAPLILATGMAVAAFVITIVNINVTSLRQSITPDHLMGRVNATVRMIIMSTPLLGALIAGALGERLGLRATLLLGAEGQLVSVLWLLLSAVTSVRDISDCTPDR